MNKITLETAKQVVPMIYCYSTPEIARHNGWVKIGYTEQDVNTNQPLLKSLWKRLLSLIFRMISEESAQLTSFRSLLRVKQL